MSSIFDIDATSREEAGKGASRRLRRMGMVPGILYGGHKDPSTIAVNHNELIRRLENEVFFSHVLTLNLDGNAENVVLKDLQRHPARPFVTHVDFQRISEDETIRMHVPLHFINEDSCPGLQMGGTASHNINEIEVICLPRDLPEFIVVDMTGMEIGHTVHISDMILPEGVVLIHTLDPHAPVVSVQGARSEEEDEVEDVIEDIGDDVDVDEDVAPE